MYNYLLKKSFKNIFLWLSLPLTLSLSQDPLNQSECKHSCSQTTGLQVTNTLKGSDAANVTATEDIWSSSPLPFALDTVSA